MPNPYFPNITTNRKQDSQTIHAPFLAYVPLVGLEYFGPVQLASYELSDPAIVAAFSTAARNSQPLPVVGSSGSDSPGICVQNGLNRVLIYDSSTNKVEFDGFEVFGEVGIFGTRLQIDFFTINNLGQKNIALVMPQAGDVLNFEIPYVFDFHTLPANALISTTIRNVREDIGALIAPPLRSEELTVFAKNTLPDLNTQPNITTAGVFFDYRGFKMIANEPGSVISVDGAGAIVYDSATAGIELYPGEVVSAFYTPFA